MASDQAGGKPVDLSRAFSRSVSVMYSGYLKNMGVHSTMVLTLIRNGKLWGLISCMHHRGPKYVSYQTRVAAELLAHVLSLTMATKEQLEEREYVIAMQALQANLMRSMLRQENFWDGLVGQAPNLLGYFDATGAVVAVGGRLHRLGDCPTDEQLTDLLTWLVQTQESEQWSSHRLASVYAPASFYQQKAAGLLSLRLFARKRQFILWFLPEVERTVHWAGDPRKPVEVAQVNGYAQLSPRTSFALWKESVKGASRPWRDSELVAASNLRRAIVEVVLRKAEIVAEMNEELVRNNLELEAFSYCASPQRET